MSEIKTNALTSLSSATGGGELDPQKLGVYLHGLLRFNDGTVAEACIDLAETETFFPALADLRAKCFQVEAKYYAPVIDERRTERLHAGEDLEPAQAAAWVAHLKTVLHALKNNQPLPAPLVTLDHQQPLYRCRTCHDTGWEHWRCPGGLRQNCGRDRSRWVDKIFFGKCREPHAVSKRCACGL